MVLLCAMAEVLMMILDELAEFHQSAGEFAPKRFQDHAVD
jgi:hypothetical protein